jgi:hypothetical protein
MHKNHISTESSGWQTKLLSGNLFDSYISEASVDDFTIKTLPFDNANLEKEILMNLAGSVTICTSVQACKSVQLCIKSDNQLETLGGFKVNGSLNNQSKRVWPVVVR